LVVRPVRISWPSLRSFASGHLGNNNTLQPSKTFVQPPRAGLEGVRPNSAPPVSVAWRVFNTREGVSMELFSAAWFSALGAIILIDLVLAGDNAIVIALAARNLPPQLQKKAIVFGTVGAIVVRSAMTIGVVWLLKIPGLMLVGGLGLVWIAYRLIAPGSPSEHGGPAAQTFLGAMKTIIVADALMGVDNVLGVAGAAHGDFGLVIAGLLISIPIVIWGSSLALKLVERFPVVIQLGAAVLAFTAGKMIVGEPLLDHVFDTCWRPVGGPPGRRRLRPTAARPTEWPRRPGRSNRCVPRSSSSTMPQRRDGRSSPCYSPAHRTTR
jgi:YjbE family integral membrane protein